MYVETDFSRSNIASTYAGLTAPASTSSCPASRIASSLLVAAPGTLTIGRGSTSLMGSPRVGVRPAGPMSRVPAGRARSTRGRGVLRVGGLQFLDDRVVLRAVH